MATFRYRPPKIQCVVCKCLIERCTRSKNKILIWQMKTTDRHNWRKKSIVVCKKSLISINPWFEKIASYKNRFFSLFCFWKKIGTRMIWAYRQTLRGTPLLEGELYLQYGTIRTYEIMSTASGRKWERTHSKPSIVVV